MLIKTENGKISRGLFVPTWCIRLVVLGKGCLMLHLMGLIGAQLPLCGFVVDCFWFFDCFLSFPATWPCCHRCVVDLALDFVKLN